MLNSLFIIYVNISDLLDNNDNPNKSYRIILSMSLKVFLSAQYKYIEDLLERCYPGAQISLDFTISNILEYFSDIAITH